MKEKKKNYEHYYRIYLFFFLIIYTGNKLLEIN